MHFNMYSSLSFSISFRLQHSRSKMERLNRKAYLVASKRRLAILTWNDPDGRKERKIKTSAYWNVYITWRRDVVQTLMFPSHSALLARAVCELPVCIDLQIRYTALHNLTSELSPTTLHPVLLRYRQRTTRHEISSTTVMHCTLRNVTEMFSKSALGAFRPVVVPTEIYRGRAASKKAFLGYNFFLLRAKDIQYKKHI